MADNSPWGDPDFETAVRETAYFLWEQDGRPYGREQEYWYAALKRCLRQKEADEMLKVGPNGPSQQDAN